ncbi:glycoside hydrolase family 2 TIM barrel-domain containing protein [Cerasicoccus fimbriatus]|uniref:glycoside hydrolase family 2 TIM barrel-domain containing protein n=1 Tax=Cerasicoccus fimbriatus TaxID=3014554 RepID=UPI0022B5C4D8|nr:glycoside hydrolase family 2 TIM barrel-domain containing protein [Cerasicoccus sp. TK19100]
MVGFSLAVSPLFSQSKVEIKETSPSHFELMVDGQPFFGKGVGGYNNLPMLKEMGGNCFRTWGVESLEKRIDGKPLLDYAHDLGLKVVVGIWLGHERHGFDYTDQSQLRKQRKDVEDAVRRYKDHPAVLMWGLGNEMEGPISDGSEIRIWKELNHLAKLVKDEDPDHPVMTVIAGIGGEKVKNIIKYYPEIDVLGVNAYASAPGVGSGLVDQGWKKPFMLTEFGPSGHWEVGHTSWGAPIEPTSREKAASYFATQKRVIEDGQGMCLGTFAFLWSHKQETTSTWYGMFLPTGEKLGTVDAMSYAWNGEFPDNRSPKLISLSSPADQKRIKRGTTQKAKVDVEDADGDNLDIEWVVTAENTDRKTGGDAEAVPPSFPELIARNGGESVEFRAPSRSGAYRLFVYIRDGEGGAATANFPFYVE